MYIYIDFRIYDSLILQSLQSSVQVWFLKILNVSVLVMSLLIPKSVGIKIPK